MLYQNLIQGQHLKIYPQQLQMLQLFHLTTFELDQRIRNELEENPLIEENIEPVEPGESPLDRGEEADDFKEWEEWDYDDYYNPSKPSKHDILLTKFCSEDFKMGLSGDFRADAMEQLHVLNLSEEEQHIGEFIINSLSDDGFLVDSPDSLVDDYMLKFTRLVSLEQMARMVDLIKTFEPIGLASSGIKEYLLVQLKRMKKKPEEARLATLILTHYYDELKTGNLTRLSRMLEVDHDRIQKALKLLGRLNLKPVSLDNYLAARLHTIVPDFVVSFHYRYPDVALFKEKSSSLKINKPLKSKIDKIKKDRKNKASSREFVKKLTAAEWFVNAIKERENVMLQVMKTIVDIQIDYFISGDELQLKPMILKNIADKVGVDLSTVSRITSNKYVQTPFGCVLLKNLFNEGIANKNGELINVKKVQETLRKLVIEENKNQPYTDSQLAKLLCEKGLKISRRTVTKYRNEIKIPPVNLRYDPVSP